MAKFRIILVILLAIIMLFSGCGFYGGGTTDRNVPDINPRAEAANKDTSNVMLYFSYRDENLLAGEMRSIDVPVSDTLEAAVIKELIKGPSADRDELVGLFWPGVELVSISTNADIFFITLSEEFITTEPEEKDLLEGRTVAQQKKLAIYSVVNTLVEMGKYSAVQFYVGSEGGVIKRIAPSDAGWSEDANQEYLEPLGRNEDLILTPENTLWQALDSFTKKDWTRLYNFTAYSSLDGSQKPAISDFSEALTDKGNSLVSFDVVGSNVAYDGQSAVVMLDYTIKTREGNSIPKLNRPFVLVREDDIWKLTYTSIVDILINT